MNAKPLQSYFLIALIFASLALTFFIFRPFLVPLILATVFAVILQPLYRSVLRRMVKSPGLAAGATMLVAAVCILLPLLFISVQVVGEAEHLYSALSVGGANTYIDTVLQYADTVVVRYVPSLASSPVDSSSYVDQYIKDGLSWLIQNLGGALGGVARLLFGLFLFLVALYYLLRDGATIRQAIITASPLADTDDEVVLARLALATNSVIRGSLTIALIQGVLTGVGFTFFGVPNSILWGVVAGFAALIPGIGTSLVLAPGIAYLFIIGATTSATGLLIWSVVVVGLIDNFLGPRLIGKGMQLHPLIVLLSVFGGLAFFGPVGIFLGPLCTSFLFALLSIYPRISGNSRVA